MTQEEKQILLVDLCARLPYGVKVELHKNVYTLLGYFDRFVILTASVPTGQQTNISNIKPYLRPMSSMTDEEKHNYFMTYASINGIDVPHPYKTQDWLNAHHFDYRGLIEKGLAIAVTKENNPYEN